MMMDSRATRSPLAGKLFDETGDRLTPSHTKKKNGQRLRYSSGQNTRTLNGAAVCTLRLGGLLSFYHREAA